MTTERVHAMTTNVQMLCMLCTARLDATDADPSRAHELVESRASELGWRRFARVPGRHEADVCAECVALVVADDVERTRISEGGTNMRATGEKPDLVGRASGMAGTRSTDQDTPHKPMEPDAPVPALREVGRSGGAAGLEAGAHCDSTTSADTAARACGWASAAEQHRYSTATPADDEPYVIIDCRSIVGNTPLFWMPFGSGYGSVVSEIGRYPKAEALRKRESDYALPLRLAVECSRPRVDIQLLNRVLQREGLEPPAMGWGHPPRCVDCEKKAHIKRRR